MRAAGTGISIAAVLQGDRELAAAFEELSLKVQQQLAPRALASGAGVLARRMRALAPKGPTGNLQKNIGSRRVKGKLVAKAGIGVGRRPQKFGRGKVVNQSSHFRNKNQPGAPHAHLVGLGTGPRYRKSIGGGKQLFQAGGALQKYGAKKQPTRRQLYTGKMPKNPFIHTATAQARQPANDAIAKSLNAGISQYWLRHRKKLTG